MFKAIQVKTTAGLDVRPEELNRTFHLLALVRLEGQGDDLFLDQCEIYLIPKEEIAAVRRAKRTLLPDYRLSADLVERLFATSRAINSARDRERPDEG